jgi:hypothetical protein
MPRLRRLSTFALALLLAGCENTTAISPQPSLLRDAPTQVRVDGYDLLLTADLWRDFMPVAPPDGQPMVAVLRIRTADGRPFPEGVTADKVSVVQGDQVWTAATRQEHSSQQANTLEVVARDGPRWDPGSRVDVIVYLHDAAGREYRLRAPDQLIQRTD